MPVQWREKMAIDGGVIDADHRRLIHIINRFESVARRGARRVEVMETLLALKAHAGSHFQREEKLQADCGFPYAEEHKAEHSSLMAELNRTIAEIGVEGSERVSRDEAVERAASLLKTWLVEHVINSDLKMRGYVAAAKDPEAV